MDKSDIDLALFGSLVPIKALSPDNCRELAAKSEQCHISKGKSIFKEGEKAEHIIYVVSGEVDLLSNGKVARRVAGGSKLSKLPLEQGAIFQHTAIARTDAICIKVDPSNLDIMLTWDQSGGYEVQELDNSPAEDDGDWMAQLLQAKVFRRIPPANIQSVFMRMKSEHFKKGESVITQGEEGGHFYIIREGKCEVIRKTRKNPEGMVLATLGPGDNFGEEALISGGKRNASITMVTDGVLMSLSKEDFLELLNEPLLKWISYSEARELVKEGAMWIDTRLPAEYQANHIKGSINIPLPLIRAKLDKFTSDRRYVFYCDTGRRSSIATYLLSQNGFDAYVLQGSLNDVPASEME
jgi:CRP-like cAMP-binding protein